MAKRSQVDQDVMEIEAALNLAAGHYGQFHRKAAAEALHRLAVAAHASYGKSGQFLFESK